MQSAYEICRAARRPSSDGPSSSGRPACLTSRKQLSCQVLYAKCRVAVKWGKSKTVHTAASTAANVIQKEEDNPEVDATYQACSKYLRSLGIENRAELARILDIAMNPNSLFHTFRDDKRDNNPFARKLDVEKDLNPLTQYLLSQGFSKDEVCKLITSHPAVLCYSPQERLAPFFDYLRGLGIERPDRTVLQRPSLLGLTVDKNLRQMIDYLQQNDYTIERIERLLATTL